MKREDDQWYPVLTFPNKLVDKGGPFLLHVAMARRSLLAALKPQNKKILDRAFRVCFKNPGSVLKGSS